MNRTGNSCARAAARSASHSNPPIQTAGGSGDLADPDSEWEPVITRFCDLAHVDRDRVKAWTFARLVSDAVSKCEQGHRVSELEARHGDLWTARLIHR